MKIHPLVSRSVAGSRIWLPVVGWVILAVALTQAMLHILMMDLSMTAYHLAAGIIQAILILVPAALFVLWRHTAQRERAVNVELRRSEEIREDLTAMLVHDLKNPVITTAMSLDLLLAENGDSRFLPESERGMMKRARRNLRRLEEMIGDVLALNAADRGAMTLDRESVDPCDLLDELVHDMTPRVVTADIDLKAADGCQAPVVRADREHIRRVLENLVSNAIDHTPSGGAVELSAESDEDQLIFSVTDTGEGIEEGVSHRLFDRYVQNGATKRTGRSSVGLGLAYCKVAVEAHGGRIWAENTDSGSQFRFALPLDGADGEWAHPS